MNLFILFITSILGTSLSTNAEKPIPFYGNGLEFIENKGQIIDMQGRPQPGKDDVEVIISFLDIVSAQLFRSLTPSLLGLNAVGMKNI